MGCFDNSTISSDIYSASITSTEYSGTITKNVYSASIECHFDGYPAWTNDLSETFETENNIIIRFKE